MRLFSAPLWRSAFRPFYLLGAGYALVLAAYWLFAQTGFAAPTASLAHAHEMPFGFAAAIVTGIALTALPSWAGTREVEGGKLAFLAALWIAGRVLWWWTAAPFALRAGIDSAYFLVLALVVTPQLLRLENRHFLWLPVIFAAFALGQIVFYSGLAHGSDPALVAGIKLASYTLMLLFVIKGGVLTPIFTGNALREKNLGLPPSFLPSLEYATGASVVLLAALDLGRAQGAWTAAAAALAFLLLLLRSLRWQGWRVADLPLLAAMHLAFLWLLLALALRAWAALDAAISPAAWQHAFFVGSLGLMMLSLMNRVTQRHTGRRLQVGKAMRVGMVSIFLAALIRVAAALLGLGGAWISLALALWALPFAIYLAVFGRCLIAPSEARADSPEAAALLKRESPPNAPG